MMIRRSFQAAAIAALTLGTGAAFAAGTHISQEIVEQLPSARSVRTVARQVPILVQPNDVPQGVDLSELTSASCAIQVQNGEKAVRNAKFKVEAQFGQISPLGQIISVAEFSANVKTGKQGGLEWDLPIANTAEQWLSGVFGVLLVDVAGSNNKKLDWYSAACRVNFAEPCVADDGSACVGAGRFGLSLGDGWTVRASNNLTAIFENGASEVEVDVVDLCPAGFYVVADDLGGNAGFDLEARDYRTGEKAFLSAADEPAHLSSCR